MCMVSSQQTERESPSLKSKSLQAAEGVHTPELTTQKHQLLPANAIQVKQMAKEAQDATT